MSCARDGLLIVGYGNPLRGDDGAGLRAASRLRGLGYRVIETHQLLPELAELVASAQAVVFVDADVTVAPGEVRVAKVAPAADGVLEHHATPAGILRLARDVYGATPRAVFIGLGGDEYGCSERLSDASERAVELCVKLVETRWPLKNRCWASMHAKCS